jgi:hypothetical protein
MKTKTNFFKAYVLAVAVALVGASCTNVEPKPNPDPTPSDKLPVIESFANGLGAFTQYSVSGDQVWEHTSQYGYVLMSGYLNASQTNFANEDWLVSGEIDLSEVTAAKLTFDHASRYFGTIATEATIWASEDYTSGNPTEATWTQVTTPAFKDQGSWPMVSSGEISLTAFAGKKIRLAFKYISTTTKAGTWQIKNFKVEEGEATVDPGTDVEPEGNGTEAAPYNVIAATTNQGASKWVTGYIVGVIDGEGMNISTESKFDAPYTIKTNILIADNAEETDFNKCVPVQLPAGAIRDGLNLVDMATLDGQKVKIYGSLETYFGKPGIKTPSYFEIDGGATGGTKPEDTSGSYLAETFATNQGAFTIVDITLPQGGTFVWKWDAMKFMKASAYISGSNKASESWVISPSINLSSATAPKLIFEHTGKFFTGNKLTEQTVFVSTNYTEGAPSTATWTQLTIPTWPSGNDWTFVSSGSIDLSSYTGNSNVRIAFKYVSTTSGAATWEFKNLVVKE